MAKINLAEMMKESSPFVYIMYGTDWSDIDNTIATFASLLEYDIIHTESILTAIKGCTQGFIKQQGVFVTRYNFKDLDKDLLSRINNTIGTSYVFIIVDDVDKRTIVYKQYKDSFIELNNPSEQSLVKFIMSQLKITTDRAITIAKSCNGDRGLIYNTIEQIHIMSKSLGKIEAIADNEATDELIPNIYVMSVFEFVNEMFISSPKDLLTIWGDIKQDISPFAVLSIAYKAHMNTLQVLTSTNPDVTGLDKWTTTQAIERTKGGITVLECKRRMSFIKECIACIKEGKLPLDYAIEYLLMFF